MKSATSGSRAPPPGASATSWWVMPRSLVITLEMRTACSCLEWSWETPSTRQSRVHSFSSMSLWQGDRACLRLCLCLLVPIRNPPTHSPEDPENAPALSASSSPSPGCGARQHLFQARLGGAYPPPSYWYPTPSSSTRLPSRPFYPLQPARPRLNCESYLWVGRSISDWEPSSRQICRASASIKKRTSLGSSASGFRALLASSGSCTESTYRFARSISG